MADMTMIWNAILTMAIGGFLWWIRSTSGAISKVKTSKDPKVLNTLKVQLDRLNAIGGLKSVVPSEGVTFMFKGKLYKYTGAFAPANQILGMLKFV